MQMDDHQVQVEDLVLFYRSGGEGPPLLLLHGFFGSSAHWERFFADLGRHFRLIVPDMRGHGRSSNPSGRFTHRQSAVDMYALLDALGIERCRAMGFSSGGMTLLHMATQQPQRIEAMVLLAATSYFPAQSREIQQAASFADLDAEALDQWRSVHVGGDAQIKTLYQNFRDFAVTHDDMNFSPALMSSITARTLIIHGDRDHHFPVDIAVGMYQAIPDAGLWILPWTNHGLLNALSSFDMQPNTAEQDKSFPFIAQDFLMGLST